MHAALLIPNRLYYRLCWWFMPGISALGKYKQDEKLKVISGYTATSRTP